jgi:GDP-4-dehydro-6-deoxy-D-mannose reductase
LRPVDEPVLRGDNSRLRTLTGWQPEITMEHIVEQLLTYWRRRIQDE